MSFAVSFALALFLSSVLVPMMVRLAPALGLVDQPDARKVHAQPIPRAGGVAIVVAFFVPLVIWGVNLGPYVALMLGAAIIAFFGFLDDRHDLSYQWKFAAQILAVAVFLAGNVEITKTPFAGLGNVVPWLSYPVLALFILGVTNAVNLSDGLDGLAAGSSLLSFVFVALLSYGAGDYALTMMAVCVMGALMGFLRFNTHPASIFMGDAGSQFLGFMAACLAVLVTQSENCAVSPVLAVLIVGLPILDTLMVIALRIRSGHSPFQPDQRHLHHQLLRAGLHHYQAVAGIYLFGFVLVVLAYVLRYQSDGLVLAAYVFYCAVVLLALFWMQHGRRPERVDASTDSDRRNPFFRRLGWFHRYGSLLVGLLLAVTVLSMVIVGRPDASVVTKSLLLTYGGLLAIWWLVQQVNVFNRTMIYMACAGALYIGTYHPVLVLTEWKSLSLLDVLLVGLAITLALTIRTTRKAQFRLDNQDLLVLFMLVIAPVAANAGLTDQATVTGAVVRLVVLLYAAEYIVSRVENPLILRALISCAWMVALAKVWFI